MNLFSKMTLKEIERYLQAATLKPQEIRLLAADSRSGVKKLLARYTARIRAERLERERLSSLLRYERQAQEKGYTYIAGVDEAGRGPLAGPVVAAAVILPPHFYLPGLNDSKQLTPGKREELFAVLQETALAWSCGVASVEEIDALNIFQATKLAMLRALHKLSITPDYVLLDGIKLEELSYPQQRINGGDRLSATVAAASIIAKVTRDRLMCELDKQYPGYGFAGNKGYATKEHRRAIARLGPCPLHRRSFLLLPEGERL
ncbi:MAG: ribonuclease HII [Firmicutes bacterium]|jgi:ribonuclease HII|nr:ribonuclease HII [Bacillota bacterium]